MRGKRWPLFLTGILLAMGVAGSMLVLRRPDSGIAEIIQDNEVLYRFDLSQTKDQVIKVEYQGRVNEIEVRDHQIHMLKADCPDHTCLNMGWLDSAVPLVCLPNRLVIRFADASEAVDALAG